MPNSSSTIAQITSNGRDVQGENAQFCIADLLMPSIGQIDSSATPSPSHRLTDSPSHPGASTAFSAIPGLYIHVPFCFHKCHYCDFYSIVDSRDRQDVFVDRLLAELAAVAPYLTGPVETIFIGGGTPTLLSVKLWQRLIAAIHQHVPRASMCEWTVEANPETVTSELATVLAAGGVNRISIGCQSFNPAHLQTLERWHDPSNVHRSVEILRAAGIDNINLDLIFAIPGQTLDEWLADLDEALSLRPTHLSCYGLMYEPNTPLAQKLKRGLITRADEDLEAAMYESAIERLAAAGFEHYEISNWARSKGRARPGLRCRHNMLYWSNANWWPLGPSAAGHFDGLRWKNIPRLQEYLDHGPLPHIVDAERLDDDGRIGEQLMLGLRLIEGIPRNVLDHLLATGRRAEERSAVLTNRLRDGLLEQVDGHVRLTRRGLLLCDGLLADLI
jgi:oxygen-independent coproporphyrinogen-3 oxidase